MADEFPYIDIHTHVNISEKEVIRVLNLGKTHILNLETEIKTNYLSAGYHPWWLKEGKDDQIRENIKRWKENEKFLFLGEFGLDNSISKKGQVELVEFHLELAQEIKRPIVIFHCVRAYSEIIQLLKKFQYKGKMIFHDYNGNLQITRELLKWGAYFSYGNKLFNESSKGFKSLSQIPIENLFFETDDQSNYSIQEIYRKASDVLEVNGLILKEKIYQNFKNLTSF